MLTYNNFKKWAELVDSYLLICAMGRGQVFKIIGEVEEQENKEEYWKTISEMIFREVVKPLNDNIYREIKNGFIKDERLEIAIKAIAISESWALPNI